MKLGIAAVAAATATIAIASPGYAAAEYRPAHPKVITLTAADNGRTVHVVRGEEVRVTLKVKLKQNPDPSTWWRPVTASGDALKALPQTLMARRGVTNGRYRAIAHGEATLSSSRAVCPTRPGAPTCHSMRGWQVTIDVR
jgi:hypothetical protein